MNWLCKHFGHKYDNTHYNRWFVPTRRECSRCRHSQESTGIDIAMKHYAQFDHPARWRDEIKNEYSPWEQFGITELEYYKRKYLSSSRRIQEIEEAIEDLTAHVSTINNTGNKLLEIEAKLGKIRQSE